MATDYDAPRDAEAAAAEQTESLDALRAQAAAPATADVVDDEANLLEDLELPGADLSHEVLAVAVVPQLEDEFRCERCFLVLHRSQRAKAGVDVCLDCA